MASIPVCIYIYICIYTQRHGGPDGEQTCAVQI